MTPRAMMETAGSGPDVVVLPGGPGFACAYLRPSLKELEDAFTVHYLDYPGCGQSIAATRPVTIEQTCLAVTDALTGVFGDRPFHVLCHSFGSIVLGDMLRAGTVPTMDRCVLASASPHSLEGCLEAQRRLLVRLSPDDLAEVVATMSGERRDNPGLIEKLLPYYSGRMENLPRLSLPLGAQIFREVMASIAPFDFGDAFARREGLLYVFGRDDFIAPDLFCAIERRMLVLPGGHFVFADARMAFVAAVRAHFLDSGRSWRP